MKLILYFILSMSAIASFAILLNAPKKQLFFCSLTGAFGWTCHQMLCQMGCSVVIASLTATFFITILSRFFAILRKNPVTLYLVVGILPFVPGSGIYYTSYHFIMNEMNQFILKGVETFQIAGAISLGILFGFAFPLPKHH